MRVVVAGWIGSRNAGDELIFTALRTKLQARGARVVPISIDPLRTTAVHGVNALGQRELGRIVATIGQADGLVFGGGGLLQDETSAFNLPYHLARVRLARARRTPVAVVGVGAGRLSTALGRWQVRATLETAVGISARDLQSVRLLHEIGLRAVTPASDLVCSLPSPTDPPEDVICACLRPWAGRRGWLPVRTRSWREVTPDVIVDRLAAGLDGAARRLGLPVRLVGFQPDTDDRLHQRVAERMRGDVRCVSAALGGVLAAVARSRVVVAMRYHAAIAAVLSGRPAVLIGYAPKLSGLADRLGPAGRLLPWDPDALAALGAAAEEVIDHYEYLPQVLAGLRALDRGNDAVLDRLFETSAP